MSKSLQDRIVLVTAASRGIGRAAAKALAAEGAHVIATARTVGGLEELDDEIKSVGGSATLVPLDIKDFEALDRLGPSIHHRRFFAPVVAARLKHFPETVDTTIEPDLFTVDSEIDSAIAAAI